MAVISWHDKSLVSPVASSLNHVGHILFMCSIPQMLNVHADRVVAGMKYEQVTRPEVMFRHDSVDSDIAAPCVIPDVAIFANGVPNEDKAAFSPLNLIHDPLVRSHAVAFQGTVSFDIALAVPAQVVRSAPPMPVDRFWARRASAHYRTHTLHHVGPPHRSGRVRGSSSCARTTQHTGGNSWHR